VWVRIASRAGQGGPWGRHRVCIYNVTEIGMVQNGRTAHANAQARFDLAHAAGVSDQSRDMNAAPPSR
jgi:hypothetical protein